MVSYGKGLLQFQCKYQLLCLLTQCYRHSNVSISYGLQWSSVTQAYSNVSISYGLPWSSVTQALMQVSIIVSYDKLSYKL